MTISILHKAVLLVAGVTALYIGASILVSPAGFYAAYDIPLAGNTSLVNELRASGGSVVMLGVLTLLGLWFTRLTFASTLLAATMYLAYGASRLLSLGLDGQPDNGLVFAMLAELVLGAASLAALVAARRAA